VKFFETSALSGVNVEEAFLTMAGDIKKKTEKKLVSFICWCFGFFGRI
jgi:Ras-related protein Rab-8A